MTIAWLASLRRFFGHRPTLNARPSDKPDSIATVAFGERPGEARLASQQIDSEPDPFDASADRRFTARLLGLTELRAAEAGPAERQVIEGIQKLANEGAEANILPRLPVVLPRVISIVRRDDVAAREMAERLALDPTLVGEVVRLANSPRYRTSREITNLQDAVVVLGQRGLIQVVIGATMRPIFDAGHGRFSRTAGSLVWDLAQRRSAACPKLCGDDTDPFHAYLAGMVADIGMIVALRVLDDEYVETQAPDSEDFHDELADAVARLSGRIARQWELHAKVCSAIERRASTRPVASRDSLLLALRTADRISKLHLLARGLADPELARLSEPERLCYVELERSFGQPQSRGPAADAS